MLNWSKKYYNNLEKGEINLIFSEKFSKKLPILYRSTEMETI